MKITITKKDEISIEQLHNCVADPSTEVDGYGIAVEYCWEDDKHRKLWAGNGEYANIVNYCPFCGYKNTAT